MYRIYDLETRIGLLVKIIEIFKQLETELSAKDIQAQLAKKKVKIPKKAVNSILFSEGKRYVKYNRENFKYSLAEVKSEDVKVGSVDLNVDFSAKDEAAETSIIPSIFIRNRSYSFVSRPFASMQLFSIKENGADISILINENHPFNKKYIHLLKNEAANNNSLFEDYLIALANLHLNTPIGPLRERVDDQLHSLAKELKHIISEQD